MGQLAVGATYVQLSSVRGCGVVTLLQSNVRVQVRTCVLFDRHAPQLVQSHKSCVHEL